MFKEIADRNESHQHVYQQFGRHIKLCMQDDAADRTRFAALLRFHTSQSDFRGPINFRVLKVSVDRQRHTRTIFARKLH